MQANILNLEGPKSKKDRRMILSKEKRKRKKKKTSKSKKGEKRKIVERNNSKDWVGEDKYIRKSFKLKKIERLIYIKKCKWDIQQRMTDRIYSRG